MEKSRLGFVLLLAAGCSGGGFDEQTSGDFDRQIDGESAVAEVPEYITLNEEAAKASGLIARVRLPHQVVEWYAPQGKLFMSEAGIAGDNVRPVTKDPSLQDMLPTELYEFLANEPAPQALVDLQANAVTDLRLSVLTDIEPGEPVSHETDAAQAGLGTTAITNSSGPGNGCTTSFFTSTFCVQGSYTWQSCQTSRSTGYHAIVNEALSLDRLTFGVCAKVGSIAVEAQFLCTPVPFGPDLLCNSNNHWGPFIVPQDTFRSFTRSADTINLLWDDAFGGEILVSGVGSGDNYAMVVKSRND